MVSRRELLTIGAGGLAAAAVTSMPARALAQTPKRGGTVKDQGVAARATERRARSKAGP